MKMIVFLCACLFAVGGIGFGQDNQFRPMKGSATPEFEETGDHGQCLVFKTYIVISEPTDEGGDDVNVWLRKGTAKGTDACRMGTNPHYSIKNSDNNSFYGISQFYFFVDQGTSAGSRTLQVFKTDSGKPVTQVEYFANSSDPRIESARYLYFDAPSTKKGPISTCKEAAKWKRQGGTVGWVQGKKLDLDTQKSTNIGTLRCVYQE